MPAEVRDRTDIYKLAGGSGFYTSFEAWCGECRWSAGSFSGEGGGSPTPWVTNAQARSLAQAQADRHNSERHEAREQRRDKWRRKNARQAA